MPLQSNAILTLARYQGDETGGVTLYFTCANPGAGEPTDYSVYLTAAIIAGITNLATFRSAVITAGQKKYRSIAALDSLINSTVTL